MLIPERWQAEKLLMQSVFPTFEPFLYPNDVFGFVGVLDGPRSRTLYEVVIKAPIKDYPAKEPAIFMHPRAENHHWIGDGRLCYQREGHTWDAARDTFAQCLSMAVKYLTEFDGR
jgi:ubiquitin-protein ligase